jgi:hypothetical protein
MHVALVPDGWITGNSLGVAYFRERSEEYLRILLGLFNSLVFELQVRAMLATAHISQGILRDCAIPSKAFTGGRDFNRLLRYVSERIQSREEDDQHALEAQIEVAVARAYGLTQDDMAALLPAFPKLQTSERDLLLKAELWA